MVSKGIATKQQAYTLGWMEFFVEAIFMLGCIDFPSDSAAILRVKAFVEALIDSERERCDDEPSYLFEDGEEIAFAAGGLMDGASDSADQAVLSAILITTKRILAFSSIDVPPEVQGVLRKLDNLDPDHIATVMQAPLQDIISASLSGPTLRYPYGSFTVIFRMPDSLKRRGMRLLTAAERRETDEQKKQVWKDYQRDMPEQICYEMALRSEDTYSHLYEMSGLLKSMGEYEGFKVSIE